MNADVITGVIVRECTRSQIWIYFLVLWIITILLLAWRIHESKKLKAQIAQMSNDKERDKKTTERGLK